MKEKMKKYAVKRDGSKLMFPCRVSFVHLDKPYAANSDAAEKYSVLAILDKDNAKLMAELEECIKVAKEEKWGNKQPYKVQTWIKDGTEKDCSVYPEYENSVFFTASSTRGITCRDTLKNEIDPKTVNSGDWCVLLVNFYAYDNKSAKGVTAGLNGLWKVSNGERLGGSGGGDSLSGDYDFGSDDIDDL